MSFQDVSTIARRIRAGKLSAVELMEQTLAGIDAIDGRLHAFVAIDREGALAAARQADAERAAGQWRGPLHGVPFGAKDLLASEALPTEVGMAIFRGRMTGHDATAIARLRAAGAILVGKLAQTEGTFSSYHPEAVAPLNPWNPEIWPGASSSGPGVAVAARLCPIALASDTGGSMRSPAAACGITSLMPSAGRVSRHGAFPLAPTMDRVGPFATSALDCAHVLTAIAGADPADPAALDEAVPDYAAALGAGLAGMRLGFDESVLADLDPEIAATMEETLGWFARAGMRIVARRLPEVRPALEGWVSIVAASTAEAHREFYPARADEYGEALAHLVELGRRTSGADVARAIALQEELAARMAGLHGDLDAMLVPTAGAQTPALAMFAQIPPIEVAYPANSRHVGTYSLSGQPAVTFPAGFSRAGLPMGVQLAGSRFGEAALLHIAHRFQQATDWHLRRPPLAAG